MVGNTQELEYQEFATQDGEFQTGIETASGITGVVYTEVDLSLIEHLQTLIDYAKTLLLSIQYEGTEVPQDQLAYYDWLTTFESPGLPLPVLEGVFKDEALVYLMGTAQAASYPFEDLDAQLGIKGLRGVPQLAEIESADRLTPRQVQTLRDTLDPTVLIDALAAVVSYAEDNLPPESLAAADELVTGYTAARQLDAAREQALAEVAAILRSWRPATEAELLQTLNGEVSRMPDSVLMVDVTDIKGAFQRYHDLIQTRHDLLWELQALHSEFTTTDAEQLEQDTRRLALIYLLHANGGFLDPAWAEMGTDALWQLMVASLRASEDPRSLIGALNRDVSDLLGWTGDPMEKLALVFFVLGFVPVLGTALGLVDFLRAMQSGNIPEALINFIPALGDIGNGLRILKNGAWDLVRRFPRLGRYANDVAKLEEVIEQVDEFADGPKATRRTAKADPEAVARRRVFAEHRIENFGYPLGFNSIEEFVDFGHDVQARLHAAGYDDAVVIMSGSSVTGESFTEAILFDTGAKRSDFDLAIVSPQAMERAREIGWPLRSGGTRTAPLDVVFLNKGWSDFGLLDFANAFSRRAGRPVNIMFYESIEALARRGEPFIQIPD